MIYYHFNIPTVGPFRCADTHIMLNKYSNYDSCSLNNHYLTTLNKLYSNSNDNDNDNDNEIILFGHREKTVKC